MQNVIFGEKAIIYLYHKPERNTVLEEVVKHNFSGDFLNIFKKVATHGSENVGLISKIDTHRRGQGKKAITEWSKSKSGGPRLYLDVQYYKGKPVYIILLAGDKSSQNNDFEKAYNRRLQLDILIKENKINFLQEIIDAEPKQKPKTITYHQGKNKKQANKNYQNAG